MVSGCILVGENSSWHFKTFRGLQTHVVTAGAAGGMGVKPLPMEAFWMTHGKICYLEIPANKAEDAAAFYASIFGWNVRTRGDGNLAFDDTGGVSGTWVKEGDRTPDERTRVYIMVDSITPALERIRQAGGRVLTPRTDIGEKMGAFAVFADPVGNEFGLYEEPSQ